MSYQVLARKWRPNCFAELVGQEHVVTAIANALDNNRLHHAYLFTGTRGVGKTTIARIFSKSLNCETGLSATPCGKCSTCIEIEQGNFIDLLEIDAASRTKVEDTRELLDNVQYRPSRGRYKVYLIDEVHMLSKHSFNALLKTLEEPPPHVKFLLATTDPQKLPVTILSRCLQFNLKALSRAQIAKQLDFILQQEQLSFDAEALSQLARAAQGSMRDALSLTDQAIAQGNGVVNLTTVTAMLGLMDKNVVLKLLNAVLQKNSAECMALVEQMAMQSADFAQILAELMSLLHQLALTQMVPEACKLETIAARAIFQLAKSIAPEHVQLLYQIVLNGKKDLVHAADPRSGVEMTLLRMLAFCPDNLVLAPQELAALTPQPVRAVATNQADVVQSQVMPDEPVSVVVAPAEKIDYPSSETGYSAAVDMDDQQQDFNNDDYAQELFEQQQAILQQTEDYGYSTHIAADLAQQDAEQHSPAVASASPSLSGASPTPLNTTESMLALRKKLLQEQALEGESETKGKKSEASTVANLAALRPANLTPNSVEPVTNHIPPQTAVAPFNDTAAEPSLMAQVDETLLPPWTMTEPVIESVTAGSDDATGSPVELPQQEVSPAFDSHGHLALDKPGEVDLDIPVFLPDQQKVLSATQVDAWSRLIDGIQVTALTKQLALHSAFTQNADVIQLLLLDSKQHLNTPSAQKQLKEALSQHFGRPVELEITLGSPINTPFAIQQKIQQIRHEYAHQVIKADSSIALMQELFAAKVDNSSIVAR